MGLHIATDFPERHAHHLVCIQRVLVLVMKRTFVLALERDRFDELLTSMSFLVCISSIASTISFFSS